MADFGTRWKTERRRRETVWQQGDQAVICCADTLDVEDAGSTNVEAFSIDVTCNGVDIESDGGTLSLGGGEFNVDSGVIATIGASFAGGVSISRPRHAPSEQVVGVRSQRHSDAHGGHFETARQQRRGRMDSRARGARSRAGHRAYTLTIDSTSGEATNFGGALDDGGTGRSLAMDFDRSAAVEPDGSEQLQRLNHGWAGMHAVRGRGDFRRSGRDRHNRERRGPWRSIWARAIRSSRRSAGPGRWRLGSSAMTLTLGGSNTGFTGDTTVIGGTLSLTSDGRIPDAGRRPHVEQGPMRRRL